MKVRHKIRKAVLGGIIIVGAIGFAGVGRWLVVNQPPVKSEAVIVLGGGPIQRIEKGVALFRQGYARRIIVSGGVPENPFQDQAQAMKRDAVSMGVPTRAIFEDNRATTTYQNAFYTKRIMLRHGWSSALVVSSSFHMRRVSLVFGLVYRGSGIRLRFVSSPDPSFYPSKWWATPEGRYLVTSELVLIPINVIQGYFGR